MQEADKVHTSSGPSRNRVTSRPSSDLACQYQDDPKAFLGSAVYEATGGIAAYMGAGYEVGFLALVKIIPEGIIVL